MEETELAVIPKEDFDELISTNSEVAENSSSCWPKMSEKEKQLLGMAYNSLRKKVANALLILQRNTRTNKEGNLRLISTGKAWPLLPAPQPNHLSAHLAISGMKN